MLSEAKTQCIRTTHNAIDGQHMLSEGIQEKNIGKVNQRDYDYANDNLKTT